MVYAVYHSNDLVAILIKDNCEFHVMVLCLKRNWSDVESHRALFWARCCFYPIGPINDISDASALLHFILFADDTNVFIRYNVWQLANMDISLTVLTTFLLNESVFLVGAISDW